ncbi:MAG: hypothetical protein DMG14_11320 [Acidobacteria bacterium]|nr:MAG: hypothetical protein DMG14_11320 [Acidobacteriota bacterium]
MTAPNPSAREIVGGTRSASAIARSRKTRSASAIARSRKTRSASAIARSRKNRPPLQKATIHRAALLLLLLLPVLAAGQPQQQKAARAVLIDAPIHVDGLLDEPAWEQAPVLSDFLQKDPREGESATEQTEIRILYTKKSILFGIRCFDSEPARILATELRRDNEFTNDDSISVILDTLHDRRSAFLFRTNPLGTRYDALVTDEGHIVDVNWDEIWYAAAKVTDTGWTVEIEIPFKALRITNEKEQTWGIDFERIIRRKSEFAYWNNYRRGFDFKQVSYAGVLAGLHDLSSGLTLRIKPFAKTALTQTSTIPSMKDETHSVSDVGLEDLKYRVTSDFTADFTLNTDFAEADVDTQVLNLTRFPVFFPEKREFFIEGGSIFDFGPGGGAASEFKFFFSRQIGLSADRQVIPIRWGSKFTGKSRGWTIGLLDAQTERFGLTPRRNFAVARLKKDVFSRSYIGGIFTSRDAAGGSSDPYNRSVGVDANFIFFRHLNISPILGSTFTPGKNKDQWAGRGRAVWDSDLIGAEVERMVVQRAVNPEMGWLLRRDFTKSKARFEIRPRPENKSIRQLFFRANVDYYTNQAGQLESRNQDLTFESLFQSGDRLFIRYSHLFDLIRKAFDIQNRLSVLPGSYTWDSTQIRFTISPNRQLSGDLGLRHQRGFYGGSNTEVSWTPIWKASRNLSVAPAYQYNRVRLPNGEFDSHIMNSQVNYAFNDRWLTSTTAQYNNAARVAVVNFRLNYIYRPNDHFFLIYNEARTLAGAPNTQSRNRSIIAKVTHSWDF